MKNTLFFLICILSLVVFPFSVKGEFYEYVDENGVKRYTDNEGRIPRSQVDEIKVHKEPFDDLPEEERQRMIEAEAARIEAIERQRAREWEHHKQMMRLRDLEKEEARKQKEFEATTTPVIITGNNQILVPVTLGYRGKTISARLLLDTGANITVIHDDIAEGLDINGGRKSKITVVGGANVTARRLPIEFISVGPKTVSEPRISILTYAGKKKAPFDGLLGLDILRLFQYTIDYTRSVIVWDG